MANIIAFTLSKQIWALNIFLNIILEPHLPTKISYESSCPYKAQTKSITNKQNIQHCWMKGSSMKEKEIHQYQMKSQS